MPFTMLATAKHVVKRAAAELAPPNTTKRQRGPPPAAALFSDVDVPRPPEAKRIPTTGPLVMAVYKVSDCAGDTLPEYNGASNACLYEILMDHHASPSILYDLKAQFEEFLKFSHHTALLGDAPTSLQDMSDVAGARALLLGLRSCESARPHPLHPKRHWASTSAHQQPRPRGPCGVCNAMASRRRRGQPAELGFPVGRLRDVEEECAWHGSA